MKKTNLGISSIAFLGATLGAQAALTSFNTGGSSDGYPIPGSLQQVMQSLLGNAGYDATSAANRVQDSGNGVTDQVWTINSSSVTAIVLEIAGNRGINNFGLYNLNDKSKKLQVFAGGESSATAAKTVTLAGGMAQVNGGPAVNVGNQFGFYLQSGNGPTYYSRESDNTPGTINDQMLTLKTDATKSLNLSSAGLGKWALPKVNGNNVTTTWNVGEYLLAWEDLDVPGGDRDYQDLLVKVSAIPVPEPSTYIGGGLALLPLLLGLRSRLAKK
jgi:hypothetical protein